MPRVVTQFVCQQCGVSSPRWAGRCPGCGEWNTLVETLQTRGGAPAARAAVPVGAARANPPQRITEVRTEVFERLRVPLEEFNRVLGGGIVPGSLVLIGGDPGVGKSTLLLNVSGLVARQHGKVLYVSGEESAEQIKLRAERLGLLEPDLLVLSETNLGRIVETVDEIEPALVVVDSIQTVYVDELESAAGSVGQLRECTMRLMRLAKSSGVPIFLVGHVTKEGAIAGPKVLEHIVDAVLYLEGERFNAFRLLRGQKNRFGSTNEVGVFEMVNEGLVEVQNPSAALLAERSEVASGSAVAVTLEGTRPLLVEVQALTSPTGFGLPRRTANGFELGRLLLMTAVLTKRVGLALSGQDIYVNVVGGIKIDEPAADLAVATAIASSFRDRPVRSQLALIGEVGLSGELRRAHGVERRVAEAAKLGFERCVVPRSTDLRRLRDADVQLVKASTLAEALDVALDQA